MGLRECKNCVEKLATVSRKDHAIANIEFGTATIRNRGRRNIAVEMTVMFMRYTHVSGHMFCSTCVKSHLFPRHILRDVYMRQHGPR